MLHPYSQSLLYGLPPTNMLLSQFVAGGHPGYYHHGGVGAASVLSLPMARHGRRAVWLMGAPRCWMVGPNKYCNWAGMGGIGGPYTRCLYGTGGGLGGPVW